MDSPSSVYSEKLPPTPISPLVLPSPEFPVCDSVPNHCMMRKRSFGSVVWGAPPTAWGSQKLVLKTMFTNDEFRLGSPDDSLLCRRRRWNRETDRGRLCDPNGWQGSEQNQASFDSWVALNTMWRNQRGIALQGPEIFQPIDWQKSAAPRDVSVSPRTVPQTDNTEICPQTPSTTRSSLDLALPKLALTDVKQSSEEVSGTGIEFSRKNAISSLSPTPGLPSTAAARMTVERTASLARFIDREVPGYIYLTSNSTGDSSEDGDFRIEDAVIEEATIAMPIAMPVPVPSRGPSLLNLRVLETGIASRAGRPVLDDTESDPETSSLITHHTNLIPTTFEIGTATVVRLYRPPPVRLIVVRGRVVAMDQPADAPWETAPAAEEAGCTSPGHFWSQIKRRFHRG